MNEIFNLKRSTNSSKSLILPPISKNDLLPHPSLLEKSFLDGSNENEISGCLAKIRDLLQVHSPTTADTLGFI